MGEVPLYTGRNVARNLGLPHKGTERAREREHARECERASQRKKERANARACESEREVERAHVYCAHRPPYEW